MPLPENLDPVARNIERWREELIDLTRRNPLLSLNLKAKSNCQISQLSPDALFALLQSVRNSVFFVPDIPDTPPDPRLRRPNVFAIPSLDLKIFNTLRQRANLALQEQGINTLFVAIGLLEWPDPQTKTTIISPLILVPVTLERLPGEEAHRLRRLEDEVELNPTLRFRLEQGDLSLTLPELPEEDDLKPSDYLAAIAELVKTRPGWNVRSECVIGRFSFLKLAMYQDLKSQAEKARAHPLVAALAGDRNALLQLPAITVPSTNALDQHPDADSPFQILDADPSQQRAIYAARAGQSFVLQGPPGTGKTQTISNIITECIATGKRVLFVSQKMAALDAVYKRLRDQGLADLCLELHSHTATKQKVLEQFKRSLNARVQGVTTNGSEIIEELAEARLPLNAFVDELHKIREPLGISLYDANGIVALGASVPDLPFVFVDSQKISRDEYQKLAALAEELASHQALFREAQTHPWRGIRAKRFSLDLQTTMRTVFGDATYLIDQLQRQTQQLADACHAEAPSGIAGTDWLLTLADLIVITPRPMPQWLVDADLAALMETCQRCETRDNAYRTQRAELLGRYAPSIFDLDHAELLARLQTRHEALLHAAFGILWPQVAAENASAMDTVLDAIGNKTDRLRRSLAALAPQCGVTATETMANARYLCSVATKASANPKPQQSWFVPGQMASLVRQYTEAREQLERYQTGRTELLSQYSEALFTLDLPTLVERFTNDYASIFRYLKPQFYKDRRLVQNTLRPDALTQPHDLRRDLALALDVTQRSSWIRSHEADLHETFGRHYQGTETQWDVLRTALKTVEDLMHDFANGSIPEILQSRLIASGPEIQALADTKDLLESSLTGIDQDIKTLKQWMPSSDLPFTDLPLAQAPLEQLRHWASELKLSLTDFGAARTAVMSLRTEPSNAIISTSQLVTDLTQARLLVTERREIEDEKQIRDRQYGAFYQGLETNWGRIRDALTWTQRVKTHFGTQPIPGDFVRCAAQGDLSVLAQITRETETLRVSRQSVIPILEQLGDYFAPEQLQTSGLALDVAPYPRVLDWLTLRLNRIGDLERWIAFQTLAETCADAGLTSFYWTTINRIPDAADIVSAFRKRFHQLWIDAISDTVPTLRQFRGEEHERRITRFQTLDLGQITDAPSRVRATAQKKIMQTNYGEVGALRRQLERKRPKAIRKILQDIPNLLFALKPCLMMSPLSVSMFLDPELIWFDVVIFDEASQIFVEDAIGSLMRGKQAIIAGDSKQLPPTSFFRTMQDGGESESEEDQDEDAEIASMATEYESILKSADTLASRDSEQFAQHPLQWHYRSRHESLIAFSRKHFYEDLQTFPSSIVASAVHFDYVSDGVYYGGKSATRSNPIEAKRVVDLVIAQLHSSPEQSVGVITFSEAQQNAIQNEIEARKKVDPSLEAILSEEGPEGLFVKNIENVQGDERDVIFLSVGYGRDSDRKLFMRFGPLSREGGERRLNVAITRARQACTVVSSLLPSEITSATRGPQLLRAYMEFARDGSERAASLLDVAHIPQAEFERAVEHALIGRGHEVHHQVGLFDYRIDLAIVDPNNSERYLLGIECDGVMYSSAETARSRDRLRSDVLRHMGWPLTRIWSADWVRNPKAELARLEDALQKSRRGQLLPQSPHISSPKTIIEPLTDATQEALPSRISETPAAYAATALPPGLTYFQAISLALSGGPNALYDTDDRQRVAFITRLIETEGPITLDAITQRLASAAGLGRSGSRIRSIVEDTVEDMTDREIIAQRDLFLWPRSMTTAPARVYRDGDPLRAFDQISLEEIGEIVIALLKVAFGMKRDELITETARLLGFSNAGVNIRERVNDALSLLELDNRIHVIGGQVRALEL